MGFQHMPKIVHKAASSKGGKLRVPKGLELLPEEWRKEIAAMGGNAKRANRNKESVTPEKNTGNGGPNLADIFGTLDE